ncbi:MAG TPA: DNA (cytosine-5-)-methyltransferase [Actinomycetota bacterium]
MAARKGRARPGSAGRVVELFAGVGGFRLGLEPNGWETVWASQWEPSTKTQHAADCYRHHFEPDVLSNEDINAVVEQMDRDGWDCFPDHDLLVGGFPCQDYSVAKARSQAEGIVGKKGVLWWAIKRIVEKKRPRLIFLENVDRLLKSPASQRGRDFAIILACLSDLGYLVEWRVVNAADYGFPQRRRRVFMVAHRVGDELEPDWSGPISMMARDGALARGFPIEPPIATDVDAPTLKLEGDLAELTQAFGVGNGQTPFHAAGIMWRRAVWTGPVATKYSGPRAVLMDVLEAVHNVPESFFIREEQRERWAYLKGPKNIPRIAKNGHEYLYSEGGIAFPDPTDQPSRTVLTGEGGVTPSRFKHVIDAGDGRLRRLTPLELERLNGFPDDWTSTGMPDGRRAFMMGNALVVGLVSRVGKALAEIG